MSVTDPQERPVGAFSGQGVFATVSSSSEEKKNVNCFPASVARLTLLPMESSSGPPWAKALRITLRFCHYPIVQMRESRLRGESCCFSKVTKLLREELGFEQGVSGLPSPCLSPSHPQPFCRCLSWADHAGLTPGPPPPGSLQSWHGPPWPLRLLPTTFQSIQEGCSELGGFDFLKSPS